MDNELVLTETDQARAVQDTGFLGQFLDPVSPSEVARKLGMPANLAHHHAQRHAALGLLREVKREGGRVYYQLVARTIKHARALLPAGDPDEYTAATLAQLHERFLIAYERSDRLADSEDPDWSVHHFGRGPLYEEPVGTPTPPGAPAPSFEAHPAHFQVRTIQLGPQGYRRLVRRLADLLSEARPDEDEGAAPCTLALVALDGDLQPGTRDSNHVSSFVPPLADEGPRP